MKTQGESIFYKNVSPELDKFGSTEVLLQSGTATPTPSSSAWEDKGWQPLVSFLLQPSPHPAQGTTVTNKSVCSLCSLTKAIWLREQAGHPHLWLQKHL